MAEVIKIQYDTEEAVRKVEQLTEAIAANKARQVELKEQLKKNEISQKEYAVQMAETTQTVNRDSQEVKKYVNIIESEVGSIKRAKAENQVLREERNKLGDATGKNAKKIAEYNKKIDANTDVINGNIDKHSKLHNTLGKLPGSFGSAAQGFLSMAKGAMAFIATPIGAVVTVVAGAVMLLVSAFKTFDPLIDKIEQGLAALSGAFTALKEGVIGLFTGQKSLSETFKETGKAMKEAAIAAAQLKEEEQELGDLAIINSEKQAKYNRQINELILQSKNRTLSERERMKLIDEALKIEEKAYQEKKNIADREFELQVNKIANGRKLTAEQKKQLREQGAEFAFQLQATKGITEEEIKALASASAKREEILNESIAIQEKAQNRRDQLAEKEAEKEAKRIEEKKKNLQTIADFETELRVKQDEQNAKDAEKQAEADEKYMEAEANRTEKELENISKKEEAEFEARGRKIMAEAEMQAKLIEMNKAAHEKMLQDAFDSMQQIIAATGKMGNARVNIIADSFSKIATINFKEVKTSKEAFIAIGSAAASLTNLITANHQAELDDLTKKKEQELALNVDSVEAQAEINRRYARKEAQLKTKQAKEDKAKALIDIAIATAIGVAKALPNLILAGVVGVLGLVQAGIVAAKEIPTFTAGNNYAKGGVIGGKPHSQGGTKFFGTDGSMFEAERGEAMFVLKKDATAEIAALSLINESKGGRSFMGAARSHLADGGEAQGISINRLVDDAIRRTPIVVKVGDIATGLTDYDNVNKAGVI
jgi:hypothetical protein